MSHRINKIRAALMPNTYIRHLAQEFDDIESLVEGSGIAADDLLSYESPVKVEQHVRLLRYAVIWRPNRIGMLCGGEVSLPTSMGHSP